jgi:hypothetical protein
MSEQQVVTALQERPAPDGYVSWQEYWTSQGMPWRTEPEIDNERQRYLTERRATKPDIERGVFPFRDVNGGIKLERPDVEWLLATHQDGRWPQEWGRTEPGMRRQGIDVRGADLRGADLRRLPLMQMRAGLDAEDWGALSATQREKCAAHFENANLHYAYLQDASLRSAHLEGANLQSTHLEGAMLRGAWLGGGHAVKGAGEGRHRTRSPTTTLRFAHLGADTNMPEVVLGNAAQGFVQLADIHWNGVDVTRIPWGQMQVTGDEQVARSPTSNGGRKSRKRRLDEYLRAARGYRQLATLTRSQGLAEDADRFAYRAQVLQRQAFLRQGQLGRALGFRLLDLIAGHGFKTRRSFITYILVILAFAAAFFTLGTGVLGIGGHDAINSPLSALVFSVTSFHGRGFFPGEGLALDDPVTVLAALEAMIGLFIEIIFIATFTQRYFAR